MTYEEWIADIKLGFDSENISLDKEDEHALIVRKMKGDLDNEDVTITWLKDLADAVGIGAGDKAGNDAELAKLRCRKKAGLFSRGYRETDDSEWLAKKLFDKAFKLFDSLKKGNVEISARLKNDAYVLMDRQIVRNKTFGGEPEDAQKERVALLKKLDGVFHPQVEEVPGARSANSV